MKLNKKHIAYFKERCLFWRDRFCLKHWRFDFSTKEKIEGYAASRHNIKTFRSIIYLNLDWTNEEGRVISNEEIDRSAKHEVLHAIFNMPEEQAISFLVNIL